MNSKAPAALVEARIQRPKTVFWIVLFLCPVMMAISGYGIWHNYSMSSEAGYDSKDIFYNVSIAVLPLILVLFLSVMATQRSESKKLIAGYQVRVEQLQKRLHFQEDFMHSMTDHASEAISIFDHQNNYWFINLSAAANLGADKKDIIGKPAIKVLGHERAAKVEAHMSEARRLGRVVEVVDQTKNIKGELRFIKSHFEVIGSFGEFAGGLMMREEDVTNLIVERERRENMLRQVMGTLIAVVDRRDPYASGHSSRVGQLSRAIAEEMQLTERDIETAEISGSLMNFGKVLVPREILTKTTALSPEELQRVRDSILTSADILSMIDFIGPVVPTLKQVLERYDGTGVPKALKGDDILATARIVTVANTYVALVSPRAHRPSMGLQESVDLLMRDADKIYDRKVVLALDHYIKNRPNKLDWIQTNKQN